MHTVTADVDRPDSELVAGFEGVPSSIASDAVGPGFAMDAGLDPVGEGTELVGTAVTVRAVPNDNLIIHKAITMAEPGDVLVVDGDGYTGAAYIGELMCTSCRANDLAGIVLDGAIRDRAEIAELGFPVYARGTHPEGPFKRAPGSINVDVAVGGVTVSPGDIVVGDGDGVAVVPADRAEAALERARDKLAAEEDLRERANAGEYLYDIGGYDERFGAFDVVDPEGEDRERDRQ